MSDGSDPSAVSGDSSAAPPAVPSPNGRPRSSCRFRTTRWSLVERAAASAGPPQQAALSDLCEAYWPPVYAFIRRSGVPAEEAEDLTQDFFATLISNGATIESADPDQGKFRTFLLGAVKFHLAHQRRRAGTQKRGGGVHLISIDAADAERRYAMEPVDGWDAEAVFNRRWALTVLENVLQQLSAQYRAAEREDWFEVLRPFLTADKSPAYEQVAERLGVNVGTARVAVHRLRKEYRDALSAEITSTLGVGEAVAHEQSELLQALAGR